MLVPLSRPNPIASRARAMRAMAESSAPVPVATYGQEVLDERLGDVLRGARKVARSAIQRARDLKSKAAQRLKDLFKKRKETKKPTTKPAAARPQPPSTRVGIPKKQPKDEPGGRVKIPTQRHAGGAPPKPGKEGPRFDSKGIPIPGPPGPEYPEPWPANLDTTSRSAGGKPVKPKKGQPPEAVLRRKGPKGKPGKYKAAVSHANMYKHMVRAIYVRGKRTGYKFHHSPAKSSQMIARRKMVQWQYAKRRKSKGGVPDRRMIELTGKGRTRDWQRHTQGEPYAVRVAKDRDYYAITGRDPY